jgi:hypothetical protein
MTSGRGRCDRARRGSTGSPGVDGAVDPVERYPADRGPEVRDGAGREWTGVR